MTKRRVCVYDAWTLPHGGGPRCKSFRSVANRRNEYTMMVVLEVNEESAFLEHRLNLKCA